MDITEAKSFDELISTMAETMKPVNPDPRDKHERKRLHTLFMATEKRLAEGQRVPEAWREEIWDLLRDYTVEADDED